MYGTSHAWSHATHRSVEALFILLATENGKRWTLLSLLPEAAWSVRGDLRAGGGLLFRVHLCSPALKASWNRGTCFTWRSLPALVSRRLRLRGSSYQLLISHTQVRVVSAQASRVPVCHGGSGDGWWWLCICSPGDDAEKYSSTFCSPSHFPSVQNPTL